MRKQFYYETDDYIKFSRKLSEAIIKAEKETKTSHKMLAETLQVNVDTLSNMFPKSAKNKKSAPGIASAYIVFRCAEEMGVSPNELLGWKHETNLDREVTPEEYELLKLTKDMSRDSQKLLLEMAKDLGSYRFIRKNNKIKNVEETISRPSNES